MTTQRDSAVWSTSSGILRKSLIPTSYFDDGRWKFGVLSVLFVVLAAFDVAGADETLENISIRELRRYAIPEAHQAVAVDETSFYAIANRSIAKYDKATEKLLVKWTAAEESPIRHLNSGIVIDGRLYCANSNWPISPLRNSVEIFAADTLRHLERKTFPETEGAINWIERHQGSWWIVFAFYGDADVRRTRLVRYTDQWQPAGEWTFPETVIQRFLPNSNSGGAFGPRGRLFVTGHDHDELYVLNLPSEGRELKHVTTVSAPIAGQGIAWDRSDIGTLYGIVRRNHEVVAMRLAESLVVNRDTTTYDYYPTASPLDDGSVWFAWHGYSSGRDQILARHLAADGAVSQLHTVSEGGAVHGPPTIITDSDDAVSVVWTSKMNGRWSILLRQLRGGRWLGTRTLSDLQHDAIYPTARTLSDGSLLVAWSEYLDGRFQIRGCQVASGQPAAPFSIASEAVDAFRPVLVTRDKDVWAIWDQCQGRNYSVHARKILPQMSDIELVSPVEEFCLKPTAIWHDGGLYVAWLRKVDVVGGPGVISQLHTLHAARRGANIWKPIETSSGETTAAELTHGLMAQIEPRPLATGGYLGPRTRPMLMPDGERVWLLWERKSNHRGGTPTIAGDLVGRTILNGQWGEAPVILSRQRMDYRVIDPPASRQGTTRMLASNLPHKGLRHYETFELDLDVNEPFQQDAWTGWTPIELPIQSELTPPRTISANGKTYNLFWADLHCHNGLTADAEGEPDEMHVYARDRAGLDVVVFTNNDFYNVPLTQYEFELGNLFAKVFTAKSGPGNRSLLSLPGFEWTSRIPGVADALLADSGNWLPPYQNRSYPNHRSVIYPPAGGPLVHFTEVGNDIARLNDAVQKAGGITLSQHNAFKLSGHQVEVGLELTSGWSNYIASHPAKFHEPLYHGAKLGFTANGDTHRRAPGLSGALTGIYAESLSPDAILDALRSRRCFATMGSKIFVDARADDSLMGQEVNAIDGRVTLTLQAIGTRPITAAVLIRDGQEVRRVEGNATQEFTASVTDENLPKGIHWYYWRITQEQTAPVLPGNLMPAHGHLAWSTPNWVVVE